ncbi:hydrolase 1, exosortase A system-associated [Zooshikella marina]|uniref:Hydrolase 1, exosortase A system-associated n=1 Tax=Zooshikella ganghwensis TaxID=202772 RepID=A0A4P9VN66_9GAMM|nr:hydrolase 1, exosortase A system-associated [Zooshikella ganghwensis]MBU2704419.1 hydrolase 1, exosortase A system-associated [Zooshikella ganghwensis]RDH44885.1 hydrolase 1, exosortase A system-associated [Zooshikella ganghwensis]
MSVSSEVPVIFPCHQQRLMGIIHKPTDESVSRGVLIIVGGPQTRVGSHRQFVLLARYLAAAGIPVMRFDYRGLGDSEGARPGFEFINDDIQAAIDVFYQQVPHLKDVVLWGLCDAASAALLYGFQDKRIAGLVLLNPWVRSEAGLAKVYVKNYYLARLVNPDLWRKVFSGQFGFTKAFGDLWGNIKQVLFPEQSSEPGKKKVNGSTETAVDFVTGMRLGLERFKGEILIILSGNDLTADEFRELLNASSPWKQVINQRHVERYEVSGATHTFSSAAWRDEVAEKTLTWLKSW